MKLLVRVKPGAKKAEIEKLNEAELSVSLKEPAKEGRANVALIKLLAEHFNVSKKQIKIVFGKTASQKVIIIKD